jgi:hypothetical protein
MGDSAQSDRPIHGRGRPRSSGIGSSVLTPPTGIPAHRDVDAPRNVDAPRELDALIPQQRTTPPATPAATGLGVCSCGHPAEFHEHLRRGSDCGACGAAACAAYRPERDGLLRRFLRLFGIGRK